MNMNIIRDMRGYSGTMIHQIFNVFTMYDLYMSVYCTVKPANKTTSLLRPPA